MHVTIGLLPVAAAVLACSSTPKTVPNPSPTTQVWAPTATDSVAVLLPTPRGFASSRSVTDRYDAATDSTTVSVKVQSQRYSPLGNRPVATFSFSYQGRTRQEIPGKVVLEVRTTEPHVFKGKGGRYLAGDSAVDFPTPAFRSATSNLGTDQILTFQIPTADYGRMLVAAQATMTVGGFDIPLGEGEVESMRDLGSRMWSGE